MRPRRRLRPTRVTEYVAELIARVTDHRRDACGICRQRCPISSIRLEQRHRPSREFGLCRPLEEYREVIAERLTEPAVKVRFLSPRYELASDCGFLGSSASAR